MRVRVTIARQFEEYADVQIPDVESIAEAVAQVNAALATPATRARMLNKLTWMRGEAKTEIDIVESACADTGGAESSSTRSR
jgi:hypothetical protein